MLPLQIHPVKPLMKSINHDLAFNASFFCAKRCICECSATVEVRAGRQRPVMSFHGGDVGNIMKATINSNRRPALSHCVQASYQDKFNLFHKRENGEMAPKIRFFKDQISKVGVYPKGFIDKEVYMDLGDVEDVIKAMLESCSRVLQGLAFNTVAWNDSVIFVDKRNIMKATINSNRRPALSHCVQADRENGEMAPKIRFFKDQIWKVGVYPQEFIDKEVYMDLDDVEEKRREPEAELSIIRAINKKLQRSYN
ncbi:hypothetical protein F2Q70_00024596 [Brassica cretica]|uniref:Uncharacterized protein n=1 Tax=Brassica cretica TaxID=69181 RepID=A0A8S9L8N7_BRACR|nr:hypothetical protein F2Q70_00024596 [Brassica cretica]